MSQLLPLVPSVRQFLVYQGCTLDMFNARQACFHTGMQLEEMSEKLQAVQQGTVTSDQHNKFEFAIGLLRDLAKEFKAGLHEGDILRGDRAEMLDGDIDLAWVSIGSAFSTSLNTYEAIHRVAKANLDKFPGGVAILDENGKVVKPKGWMAADLSDLVAPKQF